MAVDTLGAVADCLTVESYKVLWIHPARSRAFDINIWWQAISRRLGLHATRCSGHGANTPAGAEKESAVSLRSHSVGSGRGDLGDRPWC